MSDMPIVKPLNSPRTGKPVVNQYVITDEATKSIVFQSYETVIAHLDTETGAVVLDEHYWDYSITTLRYLKVFINEYVPCMMVCGKGDIEQKIRDGYIELDSLNKEHK